MGPAYGGSSVGDSELGVDVLGVGADGAQRDSHLAGDAGPSRSDARNRRTSSSRLLSGSTRASPRRTTGRGQPTAAPSVASRSAWTYPSGSGERRARGAARSTGASALAVAGGVLGERPAGPAPRWRCGPVRLPRRRRAGGREGDHVGQGGIVAATGHGRRAGSWPASGARARAGSVRSSVADSPRRSAHLRALTRSPLRPGPVPGSLPRVARRERSRRRTTRSASSSRASAVARSPSAQRSRASPTRQRYAFWGSPADSPSSSAVRRWWAERGEVAAFPGDASSAPTCMSAVPRGGESSRAASSRAWSNVRRASPSLPEGHLEVGDRDGTAEDVRDVLRPFEVGRRVAVRLEGRLEIAAAPLCEPEQGRRGGDA